MVKPLRERLLALTAQGLSDAQIGAQIGLTGRTVLQYRQRWSIPSQWRPEPQPCGTNAAYQAGCRCTPCREARNAYQRRHRATTQDQSRNAPRYGLPWTPDEDAQLLQLGAVHASRQLARTYAGCQRRLNRLRRTS